MARDPNGRDQEAGRRVQEEKGRGRLEGREEHRWVLREVQ